jgi:2-dehydro-3-deoxygalactonokinase
METQKVIANITTSDGVGVLFRKLKDSQKFLNESQENYYLGFLQAQINRLHYNFIDSLDDVPVIISGMASSSIGIRELKYAQLPFKTSGDDIITEWISPSDNCAHPVQLISGVASCSDVMRGEETQLIGIQHLLDSGNSGECLYIFPGTHSKHITVKDNKICDFRTYITGELFSILCNHSILKGSVVQATNSSINENQKQCFIKGVNAAGKSSLLNKLFTIRTNYLFKKFSKELNFYFLSGLLIGEELRQIQPSDKTIFVAAGELMQVLYKTALDVLGFSGNSTIVPSETVEKAALVGQMEIFKKN